MKRAAKKPAKSRRAGTARAGQHVATQTSAAPRPDDETEVTRRDQLPPFRRLRAYALDPSAATAMETALINEVVLRVPWEHELAPGPIGEYLEVIDHDPGSDCFYPPVDLNDPYLLAQDGLPPSEGNPQYHQQMVYGVAMTTIRNFEKA